MGKHKKKRRRKTGGKSKPKQHSPIGFNGAFCVVAKKLNLDLFLLLAIAKTESGLDPKLVNGDRRGLFQLTMKQASEFSKTITEDDLLNPIFNIEMGARLFHKYFRATRRLKSDLHRQFWSWEIALMFWAGGEDWQFIKEVKRNYWILVKNLGEMAEDCKEK